MNANDIYTLCNKESTKVRDKMDRLTDEFIFYVYDPEGTESVESAIKDSVDNESDNYDSASLLWWVKDNPDFFVNFMEGSRKHSSVYTDLNLARNEYRRNILFSEFFKYCIPYYALREACSYVRYKYYFPPSEDIDFDINAIHEIIDNYSSNTFALYKNITPLRKQVDDYMDTIIWGPQEKNASDEVRKRIQPFITNGLDYVEANQDKLRNIRRYADAHNVHFTFCFNYEYNGSDTVQRVYCEMSLGRETFVIE